MSTTATAKQSYIFGSSIGKKFVMGLTGLFLISFLVVHCFINSMIFFDPSGELFNEYAHFMGSNILIRIAEVGLFAGLILHIVDGLLLWKQNNDARPQKYIVTGKYPNLNKEYESKLLTYVLLSLSFVATVTFFIFLVIVYRQPSGLLYFILITIAGLFIKMINRVRNKNFKYNFGSRNSWYSNSMGLLGTLLLFFLIVHLIHFWVPSRFTGLEESAVPGIHDLYAEMVNVFANPAVVLIYVLSQISLAYHLLHGFSSAFQSLGLNHVKYNGVIKNAGVAFSIGIPAIFALMPIVIYLRH